MLLLIATTAACSAKLWVSRGDLPILNYAAAALRGAVAPTAVVSSLHGADAIARAGQMHGLGIYAHSPGTQVGPAFLLAWTGVAASNLASVAALLLLAAALLVMIFQGSRRWGARPALAVVAATVSVGAVGCGARYGHPDDLMATLSVLAACRALDRNQTLRAAAWCGLAGAFKPSFLPLLTLAVLLAPAGRRCAAALVGLTAAFLPWIPFLLSAGTVTALRHFTTPVTQGSVPWLLGVTEGTQLPWLRVGQLAVMGLTGAVVMLAASRRRTGGPLPAGLAFCLAGALVEVARILTDPGSFGYYDLLPTALLAVASVRLPPSLQLRAMLALLGASLVRSAQDSWLVDLNTALPTLLCALLLIYPVYLLWSTPAGNTALSAEGATP